MVYMLIHMYHVFPHKRVGEHRGVYLPGEKLQRCFESTFKASIIINDLQLSI